MVISVIVAVVLLSVLTFHAVNGLGYKVVGRVGQASPNAVGGSALVGINVPIYVIGPATLIQGLINAGINQSTVKLTTTNQLTTLPNNSMIIIDWSAIKPDIIINDSGGKVEVNLTSPVIHELANAIARGDIVGIYANASDESIVEFVLAYSWAKAVNNGLILNGAMLREEVPDYLIAYPVIPVSDKEPVVFVAKWVRPRGLIIGPIYLNQLPQFIAGIMKPILRLKDPCYAGYEQYIGGSQLSPALSIYSVGDSTLIWTAPMWVGISDSGVEGYIDGNGTFYWDTCLAVANSINEEQLGGYSPTYYLAVQVLGYENYYESSTMYGNNGYVVSQLGAIDYYYGYQQYSAGVTNAFVGDQGGGTFSPSSWNPRAISNTASYTVSFGVTVTGIPSVSVSISLPTGTSESIGGSLSPAETTSFNGWTVEVANITWTFNIGYGANQRDFPNSFEDLTPANMYLSGLTSQSMAVFNVDFENNVVTAQYPCAYEVHQTTWADIEWVVIVTPQSSTIANISGKPYIYSQSPPYSYVTGTTTYAVPIICPP
ncbi:hypothetical protein [Vulcanisaeta distributa]|uniref:hypothetical protein n=1 Tax=Vulcanisaeta distributa TaxID=164451 RepID=UPI001FE1CCF7|nr:hypothetical protein [Vulcanisaeta distributa]